MESPDTGNGSGRSTVWTLLSGGILVVLVWGAYFGSLEGPFTFDDWHVIPENPAVRDLENIPAFYRDITLFSVLEGNRDYRPLFMTSMALCWAVGEGAVRPFHLTSVALHAFAVLCLFGVLRRMLVHESRHGGGLQGQSGAAAAWLGAALFAVHPLTTESIAYISSQSVPIAIAFVLLSFYLFLCVYAGRRDGPGSWLLRIASWAAYALALLGKPIAFVLPLLLVLWDLLLGRRGSGADGPAPSLILGVRKHIPFAALSGAYLLVRRAVFDGPFGGSEPVRDFYEHALTQTRAIWTHYLKLAAWPTGQNVDLAYPVSTTWTDPRVLIALGVCALFLALLWRFRRHGSVVLCCLWFPAGFLITSYGVVLRQVTNEHRAYLSVAGFCALVAIVLFKLRDRLPWTASDLTVGRRSGRMLLAGFAVIALVSLTALTHERNQVWSSKLSLWEDAANNGGTWRAHMNYALALEDEGRADEALFEFRRAVEIGPYAFAHLNLGLAYVRRGENERGLGHLRQATTLFPTSPDTHLHLGVGLLKTGHLAEAETSLKKALELRPESIRAREELVQLYEQQQRLPEAEPYLRSLIPWKPDDVELRFRFAYALQTLGHSDEAIAQYQELLRLDPDHVQGTFNLAYAHVKGESAEGWRQAIPLFHRVLALKPDYHACLLHLASAHRQLGQEAEADRFQQRYTQALESS